MKKDIRNLLMVLGVSVASAVALTGSLLYFYGPSGQYDAKNILLEPSLMARLNYNDNNPKINQVDRYQFDKIIYQFWSAKRQEIGSLDIDLPTYEKFYDLIKNDQSLEKPSDDIVALFSRSSPARLIIKVKTESSDKWQNDSKEFQRVEFAENSDFYRVELHEDKKGAHWAYFKHTQIYQEAFNLFIPKA